MFPLREVLWAVLPSLVVAALLRLVLGIASRRGADTRWSTPIALAAGYLAGHLATYGLPPWRPSHEIEAAHWLALIAAVALAFGVVEAIVVRPRQGQPSPSRVRFWATVVVWAVRFALSLAIVDLVLHARMVPEAEGRLSAGLALTLGLAAFAARANAQLLAERLPAGAVVACWLLVLSVQSAALVLSGTLMVGLLAAALASAFGGWLLASAGPRDLDLSRGGVAVLAALSAGLLLNGIGYAEMSPLRAGLIAAAPAGLWLSRLGPIRRLGRGPALAVGIIAVLIPLVLALLVAGAPASAELEPYDPAEL